MRSRNLNKIDLTFVSFLKNVSLLRHETQLVSKVNFLQDPINFLSHHGNSMIRKVLFLFLSLWLLRLTPQNDTYIFPARKRSAGIRLCFLVSIRILAAFGPEEEKRTYRIQRKFHRM